MCLWHGVLRVVCAVVRVVREHVYQMPLGCSSPGAADVPCRFVWVSGMALPRLGMESRVCVDSMGVCSICVAAICSNTVTVLGVLCCA